ncbi:hypothetical protein ACFX2H_003171 [Malus domestica]
MWYGVEFSDEKAVTYVEACCLDLELPRLQSFVGNVPLTRQSTMESCQFGVVLTCDTSAAGFTSMLGLSKYSIRIKRFNWWSRAEPRPASTSM